jgi:hypothetical protein
MLSEVRKYGVAVTLAHKHVLQADCHVCEAIMGNVGNMVAFRVGAPDAPIITTQLPGVMVEDLTSLPNHEAYVRMMTDGAKSKPFSMRSNP